MRAIHHHKPISHQPISNYHILYGTTGALLLLTVISALILTSSPISADNIQPRNATTGAAVTVSSTCSMTKNTTEEHSVVLTNNSTQSTVGHTTLQAICNDIGGFAIYTIGYTGGEDGITAGTNTKLARQRGIGDDNTSYDIDSTPDTAGGTAITLSGSKSDWGVRIAAVSGDYTPTVETSFTSLRTIPNSYTKVASYPSRTDSGSGAIGGSVDVTYGIAVSQTQPAGTYVGQVKYTLVHPSSNETIYPTDRYMQNVDDWGGYLAVGETTTAVDLRDGEVYVVGKLKDNRIWMLDNLRLDPTTADLTADNTNATAFAIINFLNGSTTAPETGWTTEKVNTSWSNTYTAPKINLTHTDSETGITYTKDTVIEQHYGPGSGKRGVYYNYCAATVGTYCYGSDFGVDVADTKTDAPQDLCPAGWRMPTSGSGGEYQVLANKYGGNTESDLSNSLQYNLSLLLSGYLVSGSQYYYGSNGYWWSSTWNSVSNMYLLSADATFVNPTYNYGRYNGFSMRCIAD